MEGITRVGDVVPQRVPVMLARETAMVLVMEVSMMVTEAAGTDLSVEGTTV